MIPWSGIADLLSMQREDGAWRGDCHGGPRVTALTLVVEARFGVLGEADRADAVRWLRRWQGADGGFPWGPVRPVPAPTAKARSGAGRPAPDPGGRSDLTATACAYAGLLAAGVPRSDPALSRAEAFLAARGGIAAHDPAARVILAQAGVLPGPEPGSRGAGAYADPGVPPARRGARSLLPGARRDPGPGWPEAFRRQVIPAAVQGLAGTLTRREAARTDRYLSDHQGPAGSWGGELLPTLLAVTTLSILGVGPGDARIAKALDHLAHWKRQDGDGLEVLAFTTEVRNTADAVRILADSGLANPPDAHLARGLDWLLDHQADIPAARGWVVPSGGTGGWPAGPHNSPRPDCRTTGAVLACLGALTEATTAPARVRHAIRRGATWLLSMQHPSGGWSVYGAGPADPHTTALALFGLGRCGYRAGDPPVDAAVRALQIARTSPAAARALRAVGLPAPAADPSLSPPGAPDIHDPVAARLRRLDALMDGGRAADGEPPAADGGD